MDTRVVEYQVGTRLGNRNGKTATAAIVNAESGVSLELFYGDLLPKVEASVEVSDITEAWRAMQFMPRLQRLRGDTLEDVALFVRGDLHDPWRVGLLANDLDMFPDDLVAEKWRYRSRALSDLQPPAPEATPVEPPQVPPPPVIVDERFSRRLLRWWQRLWARPTTAADAPGA